MRKNKREKADRPSAGPARLKVVIMGVVLGMAYVVLVARLAQLMMFSDEKVERYSERQSRGSVRISLPRGQIYDRNMRQLAVSVDMPSVYINPVKTPNPAAAARKLAALLEPENPSTRARVYRKLKRSITRRRDRSFVWVRRKVPPAVKDRIKAADIPGVGFVKESKRFYPKRDIAAKIVGFCGIDNQGLSGLEYRYDEVIRPVKGRFTVLKDALGRPLSMPDALDVVEESAPYDLVLTIDERIQYIAEKALERRVNELGAASGVAIVMSPATGRILAIAEQPEFNPNNFARYDAKRRRLMAVSEAWEPGSTFKIFVAAAALEEGVTDVNDVIDCEDGRYMVGGHYFNEANYHRYGLLPLADVIAKSSNIGAIKLAERMGPEVLRKRLESFGFSSKMGVDLPGESPGLLRPVSEWSLTSLPSISFGQEVAVTPIQLITGMCVFANGGLLVRPHVVRYFARDGHVVREVEPEIRRRVVSASTARKIKDMMIEVVENGTGKRATVPGFTVAGKTGTAQKTDPHTRTYSRTKFLSSFAGFFPAEEPRLAILVMIDEPEGVAWGGAVAGPVFSEIAARAARILRIPSAKTDVYQIDWGKLTRKDGMRPDETGATGAAGERDRDEIS
ncbi:MAG: peptidoglycan D,D-transpeptidase FtsI family protein [Candidatus Nitrospinota bacterium M3_3B_026]